MPMDKSDDSPLGELLLNDDGDKDNIQGSSQPPQTITYDGNDCLEFKVHISRIPTTFTEEIVKRILLTKMGCSEESIISIELVYPRNDPQNDDTPAAENDDALSDARKKEDNREITPDDNKGDTLREHRGFGFVTFISHELMEGALKLNTIKGGRKVTSKKQHTMHIRPYVTVEKSTTRTETNTTDADSNTVTGGHDLCYLWSLHRCPYGDGCKFRHVGEGGCAAKSGERGGTDSEQGPARKKGKCFAYKKGKCSKGDACPFSHDFEPKAGNENSTSSTGKSPLGGDSNDQVAVKCTLATESQRSFPSQTVKDCINWKSKGRCRKGDKCPYRHDPDLQRKALEKRQKRKTSKDGKEPLLNDGISGGAGKQKKEKQPLSVRVFGLNYETTEQDVRGFFQDCGKIHDVSFPTFEDSGRSKGYCGVWFSSPKAVAKALELDGQELHGRWLRIQSGKMMDEWDQLHSPSDESGMGQRKRFKYDKDTVPPSLAVE